MSFRQLEYLLPMIRHNFFRPSWRSGFRMMDRRMGDMDRHMDRHMDSMFNHFRKMMPAMNPRFEQWSLDNPIVKDEDGSRKLQLHFDLSHFKPEDIKLKVENDQLSVQAKSEQGEGGSKILREYFRQMTLPSEVKVDDMKSMFQDGILTVEAPLPSEEPVKQSQGVDIPIEMNDSADKAK